VSSYGTLHERRCVAAIRRLLPGAELVNPARMFASADDWRDRWPEVLDDIDGLVLFADERGAVGSGCLVEVVDAHRLLVPVALLDPATRKLHRLAGLDFPPIPTPRDAGHPVAGEVLTWQVTPRPPRIREAP
jgi:hypothetical protein